MTQAEIETEVIEMMRALLADLPDRIAPALAVRESPAECEAIIRAAIIEALSGLEDAAPGRRN
jgi:hypothetical protein